MLTLRLHVRVYRTTVIAFLLSLLCSTGAVGCARPKEGSYNWSLQNGRGEIFKIYCFKDHVVNLQVRSTGKSDVDLFVKKDGRDFMKDVGSSSDCFLSFIPGSSGTYEIQVVNRKLDPVDPYNRNGPNDGTFEFKQFEQGNLPSEGSFDWFLGKGEKQTLQIYCLKGQKMELRLQSKQRSDIDLFVTHKLKTIEKDESPSSHCSLSFVPDETGFYEVEIKNRVLRPRDPEGRNGPNSGTLTYQRGN